MQRRSLKAAEDRRRAARRLFRRRIRGETAAHEWFSLVEELGAPTVLRMQAVTRRAANRGQLALWLMVRRIEMENELERLGLPRNVWSQVGCWPNVWTDLLGISSEPAPLDRIEFNVNLNQPPGAFSFGEWLRDVRDGDAQNTAFWAAASAWTANAARQTRSPEMRFRLGRILEACTVNLRFPERGRELVQQERRRLEEELRHANARDLSMRGAKGGAAGRGKAKVPHTELIRRVIAAGVRNLAELLEVLRDELWQSLEPRGTPVAEIVVNDEGKFVVFEYDLGRSDPLPRRIADSGVASMKFSSLERMLQRMRRQLGRSSRRRRPDK